MDLEDVVDGSNTQLQDFSLHLPEELEKQHQASDRTTSPLTEVNATSEV
jgi:hypothetical protein